MEAQKTAAATAPAANSATPRTLSPQVRMAMVFIGNPITSAQHLELRKQAVRVLEEDFAGLKRGQSGRERRVRKALARPSVRQATRDLSRDALAVAQQRQAQTAAANGALFETR